MLMNTFFQQLKKHVEGDVHCDTIHRKIYSIDASIYEVEPLGIVTPRTTQGLQQALQIAAEHNVSVTARGAATGITGGCLGKGLIIDTSKYLNQILRIDLENEYALCQPGVVQDRLNERLSPHGYRLGPDTSTGNRATLGGMLGNNAAGSRSLLYGRMVDHVESLELALSGGDLLYFQPVEEAEWKKKCEQPNREGFIYKEVNRIRETYRQKIETLFPRIPRRVSGYNLDELLSPFPLNLSKLVVGSEGSLGIATEIKVKISKKPRHTALCILHMTDMVAGMHFIPEMLTHHPIALEMIDDKILEAGKQSPSMRNKLQWLKGNPQALFIAELEGESSLQLSEKCQAFIEHMKHHKIGDAYTILSDPISMSNVWEVRKAGLGLLLSKRTYSRAIAFIEDISVPPKNLASFIAEFKHYLTSIGKDAGIYGHIGSGCMHIRPYIDLRNEKDRSLMQEIMLTVADIVRRQGGAMSGEHGDGLIRSWMNEMMFGADLYAAFKEVKNAFDPLNLMNPEKVVDGPPLFENLKRAPDQKPISTFLDFSAEGGLELAADLCNGNGQCRKKEKLMCPSFQVTGDEYHTTRARAQSLRAIFNGRMPVKAFTSHDLYEVLDLCIECKGCKTECPSQVDMAKMKAEFLYQYHKKHGYTLRQRLMGHIASANYFFSFLPSLFNTLSSSRLGKYLLNFCGISTKRTLPQLTTETFSHWFKKQTFIKSDQQVVLFNDTYTEYNRPEIGKAACHVLQALGYELILLSGECCGRPLISKGLLPSAKKKAKSLANRLSSYIEQEIPVIFLEPSCYSAVADDYEGLLGTATRSFTFSFDHFIHNHLKEGRLPLVFQKNETHVLVHTHCHQKALSGSSQTIEVLKSIPGYVVKEIESGCCGLAGSFGYEKEHYEFSIQIGNLHLFPQVLASDKNTLIVANGFSCSCQIQHGTQRDTIHLAEALAKQLLISVTTKN